MLLVRTKQGDFSLEKRSNFSIVYGYEGEQTLSFDISVMDDNYRYLRTRGKLLYDDNRYNIQKINKRKTISTIIAELDLNEWKQRIHREFEMKDAMFTDVILRILPDGWYLENAGAAKGKGSLSLQGVNDYEILMECKNVYHIVYEYHIEERCIKVLDPSTVQQRGLYLSDELNLSSVEYKGDFSNQVNRLYAYGKKTEITHEDGTKETSYVSFASINDGKEYVDCMDHICDEILCAYWQDDKITDKMELLREAKTKIKELAAPDQSWSCNIFDLSRTNKKYRHLDFHLYDKPTLLCDGQAIVHQIVEYTKYPDNENLNKVVLSTTFRKIEGVVTSIKANVDKVNQDLMVKERVLNELTRDVNNNTLRIENTFTKDEIDTIQESILQQTNEGITASVSEVNKRIDRIDIKAIQLHMIKEGTMLTRDVSAIVLQAQVSENAQDITDTIPSLSFTWQRKSKDISGDEQWNEAHQFMNNVTITHDDVFQSASFQVTVETAAFTKLSGYETITDETDIPKLSLYLDSNKPEFQTYDKNTGSITPQWDPLTIIPAVTDGIMHVPLSDCEVSWKRSDGNLQTGETVTDGVLNVSQNKLNEVSSKIINYICSIRYKGYQATASKPFALVVNGTDGQNGQDGKDGVSIVSTLVTYQASASGITIPTGTWSDIIPPVSANQFLWTRTIITMSDDSSSTSYSIGKIGANGTDGKNGNNGKDGIDGKGIKTTTVTYQTSISGTTTPSGTWTSTIPTVAENQYLWTRTVITYTDNSSTTSYSIGKIGQKGATGQKGDKGDKGDSGVGIKSVTNYYLASASGSGVSASTAGWTTAVQMISESKKYLWNYEVVTYTNNTTTSTPPCIIGAYGEKGQAGSAGVGISTITEYYAVSTSNTTAPSSWITTVPAMSATNKYLWNYEKITYTNSSTKETAKRVIGVYGDKGATGATGNGVSSMIAEYYLSTSKTTQAGGSWGTSAPTWSTAKYMWTRTKITYTSGTVNYTTPVCDSSWEAVNEIEVGGRNLARKTAVHTKKDTGWTGGTNVCFGGYIVYLPEGAKAGDQITVSFDYICKDIKSASGTNASFRLQGSGNVTGWDAGQYQSNPFPVNKSGKFSAVYTLSASHITNEYWSTSVRADYVASGSVELYNYKVEKGNKATDWTPAPEDVTDKIDTDIAETETKITTDFTSQLNTTKEKISADVEKITTAVGENGTLINDLKNKIELTNEDFTVIKTNVQKVEDAIGGKVDKTKLEEWARFNGASLELGTSDSPFKVLLTNTELAFYQNKNKVAWINNNNLQIAYGVILNAIKIGSFEFRHVSGVGLVLNKWE